MLPTPNLGYLSGKSLARVRQQLTCLPITYLIQPPPQSEALTTPTYLKRWSGADPPLSRSSLLEDPGCPSSLPNQTGIFGIKGGSWCRRCGGTAPTVPLPSVCVCVSETWCSGNINGQRRSTQPPSLPGEAGSSLPYHLPNAWPSGPPLSGSLGGGWLSPPAMLGEPSPTSQLGHRHLKPVLAALCTPAYWRRRRGGEAVPGEPCPAQA